MPGILLSFTNWLLQVFVSIIEANFINEKHSSQHQQILTTLVQLLEKITTNPFLMANFHVAKQEDPDLLKKIQKKFNEIKNALSNKTFVSLKHTKAIEEHFDQLLSTKKDTPTTKSLKSNSKPDDVEHITLCLQPFVAVNVLLNPNCSTQNYVSHLLMIQQLKSYSCARLFSELIRSAFISLYNISRDSEINRESMWFAFTFIKVPYILKQLNTTNSKYI